MSFANPLWLWASVIVPLVFLLALHVGRRLVERNSAWVSRPLWRRVGFRVEQRPVSAVLLAAIVGFSVLALARPRWGHSEQVIRASGADVVFVLDSSLSMAAEDLEPNRLVVAKTLIRRMLGELTGDRLGLVQAEGEGFVLAPLTFDSAVVDLLLDTVEVATLPKPGTQLTEALKVAVNLFDDKSEGSAVLVLFSDGEDHGRNLEPFARKVAEQGIMVLAGGLGSPQGVPIPIDFDGSRDFKKDENGQVVVSRLLEESLEILARETGGLYRRFDDGGADVQLFLDAIDRRERQKREQRLQHQQEERFQWPLFAAIGCLVALLVIDPSKRTTPEASDS